MNAHLCYRSCSVSIPLVQVEDSIKNMRVLDALAESTRSGRMVAISEMSI